MNWDASIGAGLLLAGLLSAVILIWRDMRNKRDRSQQ